MGLYSNHIFPRILDWTLGSAEVGRERSAALAPASGVVLEIGFGTGLNLAHYPGEVIEVVGIDTAAMLRDRVEKRIREARMPVKLIYLDASGKLPFADDSFDSVVTTFMLCSIDELRPALAEMRRVLKPEGRYIFLEHGRSDDPAVARRQDLWNPVQRFIACGCNVNRPVEQIIRGAGLKVVALDRYLMPATPRIFAEMYRGIARKN